jgi:hypothetical protein
MLTIRRLEVKVALLPLLSGNIAVKRLILIEPTLLVEANKSGKLNLEFEPSEKAVSTVPADERLAAGKTKLSFNKLRIEKGNFTYKDGKSGKTVTLMLDTLNAEASGFNSPVKVKVRGAYRSKPFEVKGTLGPLTALLTHDKTWPLNLTAEALGSTLTINGEIKDPMALRGISVTFSLRGDDLGKVTKLSGASLPLKGPFSISGRALDTGLKAYNISELAVKLGESDLKGSLGVNLAAHPLLVTGDFSSQKLDVRPFLRGNAASVAAKKPAEARKKRDRLFPNDPLPVAALTKIDGSIKIKAEKLLLPRLACSDLNTEMMLREGNLTVMQMKAGIGGGRVTGEGELQLLDRSLNFAGKVKVKDSDLGTMLKELNVTEDLVGHVDSDLNVKGHGATLAELMGSLNGTTTLVMSNGRIKNKYINLLGGDLSSSAFRLLNPVGKKEEYTEFNCLVNRFDIKDGIADCTVLAFDTNRMSVIGEGNIDLRTEKLDISFAPRPKEGLGNKGTGKVSFNLSELAKPFKLSGTLASPSLAVDSTKAAISIGKGIGSYALLGPMGVAAAFLGSSSTEENLCVVAMEALNKGRKISDLQKPKEEKGVVNQTTEGVKEKAKEVGRELKKLFGR